MAISAHYTNGSKERERRSLRPYPLFTVDEAAEVPLAICRLNGGHPWPPADVARALDMGARTPRFYYLTAAARDYGFTLGTRDANRIELTDLGRRLATAVDAGTRRQIKRNAFLRVEVFRDVLGHYNGENLPDLRFMGNTLTTEFGIAPEHHREFVDLFNRNYTATVDTDGLPPVVNAPVSERLFEPFESRSTESALTDVELAVGSDRPKDRIAPNTSGKALVIVPSTEAGDFAPGFFREVSIGLLHPALRSAFGDDVDVVDSVSPYADGFIESVRNAPLVVVDISVPDAMVSLALGLRLGAGQPIVVARASGVIGPPLSQPVVEYNRNLWPSTLRDDLARLSELIASTH